MKAMNIQFKTAVFIVASAFTLLFSNMAVAGTDEKNKDNSVELRYVGNANKQPQFTLIFNDKTVNSYIVTVKEGNGDILFSEKLSGKTQRTYQLDSDDAERIQGTTFEVTNISTKITTVYKISNVTQTLESISVAKL